MKRFLVVLLVSITVCTAIYSRDPQRGYRGFLDWDNNIGRTTYFDNTDGKEKRDTDWISGLSTTHGYQINKHMFVGAGVLLAFGTPSLNTTLPIYLDFRYDTSIDKFRPFGDIRLGYNLADGGGIYFSPVIGHRFTWNRKLGLNLGVGLMLRGRSTEVYQINPFPGSNPDQNEYWVESLGKKHHTDAFFTFRIGIDF